MGINVKFCTNRHMLDDFKSDYSEYFSVIETDTDVYCEINEGISVKELIQKFRGYLSIDALLAFIDDQIVLETLLLINIQGNEFDNEKRLKKINKI